MSLLAFRNILECYILTNAESSVFSCFCVLQLEKVKAECGEEIAQLRRSLVKSKQESRELALKVEMSRLQAEEEAKEQALRLSKQLEKMKETQEAQVCGAACRSKIL